MFFKAVISVLAIAVISRQLVEGQAEAGSFVNRIHDIGGTIRFQNPRTVIVEGFTWDGVGGGGVYLYAYRPGVNPSGRNGFVIPVSGQFGRPNSNPPGALMNTRFTGQTITATLNEGDDFCDIGTLTVWCEPFNIIFGTAGIQRSVFVNDGADPCTLVDGGGPVVDTSFDNCIPLHESLQLSWRVDRDNSQVRFRLCGCQSNQPGTNQYMGFGLSGSNTQTFMVGADTTIAWVDVVTAEGNAVDYHLTQRAQCRAGQGACPDTLIAGAQCTNDVSDVSGSFMDGQQCVSFVRPFSTSDSTCDLTINPDEEQFIVWGVGPLGETAFQHFERANMGDDPLRLGREPANQCENVDLQCISCEPYVNERIVARENTTFLAQIGPSGGERGYVSLTGLPSWGIAWYINGTLVPELIVERGKTYRFLTEGGNDPNTIPLFHPFYLTDSISGGRLQNMPEDREGETVYAGFDGDTPLGVGPLCALDETLQATTSRQTCEDLATYLPLLEPMDPALCNSPEAGVLEWTPDETTPDLLYYQCATHIHLGWRVIVVNEGDPVPDRIPISIPTTQSGAKALLVGSISLFIAMAVAALFEY